MAPETSPDTALGKAAGTMVHHCPLPPGWEVQDRSQREVHQPVAEASVRDRRYRLHHRHKACHIPTELHNRTPTRGNQRRRQGSVAYTSRPGCRRWDESGPLPASVSVDQLVRTESALMAQYSGEVLRTWERVQSGLRQQSVPMRWIRSPRHVEPAAAPEVQGYSLKPATELELNQ
jgi:hypothetical protein